MDRRDGIGRGARRPSRVADAPSKTRTEPALAGSVNRAIEDVRYIRDIIDASQVFFVSGWSGVIAGVVTMAGAIITAWVLARPGPWDVSSTLWGLWILVGVVQLSSDLFFFVRRSREYGRPAFSALMGKVVLAQAIMTAEGLILTIVFIQIGLPQYIPGVWLLAFGTTVAALGFFIPGGVWVLGLTSFFAAVAAFVVPSGGLWCIGFGGAAMCLWGAAYLIVRGK